MYFTQGSEVFTEELQLVSNSEGALKWILGLFYFDENGYRVGGTRTTMVTTDNQVDSVSRAVFGQVDYRLTEKLELTTGLRYTQDEKTTTLSNPFTGVFVGEDSNEWSKVTGRLGLNYYANDNLMLYALYSTGYNAGGYNQLLTYDPEEVAAYEFGMKSRWLEERLQLNVSAFYNDYSDKQEQLLGPDGQGGFVRTFRNAAAASIPGIEVELQARPNDVWLFDGSIAYQEARYDAYLTDDPANPALGVQDLSGNELIDSPDLTVNLGVQADWPLSANAGTLQMRVDLSWVDERYFRAFNLPSDRVDSYHRSNASLKWLSPSRAWYAQLYVKNIEDDDIVANYVLAGTRGIKFYFDPRTYCAKIGYAF
jgi:iron complex outermembrane receptor protein